MSGWNFDDAGKFDSAADANDWADRNGIDHRDLHLARDGKGVKASVRRLPNNHPTYSDRNNRRRDGFF